MAVDFDEEQRWIVLRRGALAIACNLGEASVAVPVTGELVLGWGEPGLDADGADLPSHSVAIVREG